MKKLVCTELLLLQPLVDTKRVLGSKNRKFYNHICKNRRFATSGCQEKSKCGWLSKDAMFAIIGIVCLKSNKILSKEKRNDDR